MADKAKAGSSAQEKTAEQKPSVKGERRKIPGNFPYTSSPGALKRALEKIPTSEKPGIFNTDFLETILGVTGGSGRPIPSILKAAGFLSGNGNPTELYAQFQTESGRSAAALQALKNAFAEVFRRNQYAHRADDAALLDIIVAVTGLPKTDSIVRSVLNTFQVFQGYAKNAREVDVPPSDQAERPANSLGNESTTIANNTSSALGLVYNINIVLPETTNIEVYNTIFRSIKGNLLS
jgi:hypothetical protein